MDVDSVCSYFVAKVDSFAALKRCVESKQWACKDRLNPPHPREILASALHKGKVILIFSIMNNHGWHGFSEVTSSPVVSVNKQTQETSENTNKTIDSRASAGNTVEQNLVNKWHYFDVDWQLNFLEFGEQCLPSKLTEELVCLENNKEISINKCRNWQELNEETGNKLCSFMKNRLQELRKERADKAQKEKENIPKPFYAEGEAVSVNDSWQKIVSKVEKDLGKVILACPFGSQRYNLQTAASDTDMFIVYQAKTDDILGFHPPKQTIKNHETETCDYTIHEVYRYCELLLQGDARCVETLFLHDSTVVKDSPEWHNLKQGRALFLNRECLEKYLRDAQGSKGTKYLQKWCKENPQAMHLNPKMCKMLYVIVRLLQNASNVARCEELNVFREDASPERQELMYIRAGDVTIQEGWDIINRLESQIKEKSENVPDTRAEAEEFLEKWLLILRFCEFGSGPVVERSTCLPSKPEVA